MAKYYLCRFRKNATRDADPVRTWGTDTMFPGGQAPPSAEHCVFHAYNIISAKRVGKLESVFLQARCAEFEYQGPRFFSSWGIHALTTISFARKVGPKTIITELENNRY